MMHFQRNLLKCEIAAFALHTVPHVVVDIVDANTRTHSANYFKINLHGQESISSFSPEFQLDKIYRLKFQKHESGKLCLLSCAQDGTQFIKTRYSLCKYCGHLLRSINSEMSICVLEIIRLWDKRLASAYELSQAEESE